MNQGVQGFIDDVTRRGFSPRTEAGLVIYQVEPIDGELAGTVVETGVSVEELVSWPQIPPHWVHFPLDVKFKQTNSEPSAKTGWAKHSRDLRGWGDAEPAICWTSHVRAVLGEAIG